jgi:hypothetical protein
MKWNSINVELIDEYAKELSWDKRYSVLEDQLYVVAKQNRKLNRIRTQVDWAITDSPLIMALPYAVDNYLPNNFRPMVHELFNTYDNLNIMLRRTKPFFPIGRHHTEEESIALDSVIENLLIKNGYDYHIVDANENAKFEIMRLTGIQIYDT